jgi:tetratricopeptide (TPR) repeat protein
MRLTTIRFALFAAALMLANTVYSGPIPEQLKQMIEQLQKTPDDGALRASIIKLARGQRPALTIPEEARRAFVRGNTAFTEAKSPDDYARAVQRYEEALLIAPWWGDPYFNLAKAQELRQDYGRAIQSVKFFILTGPAEGDARKAQDYGYALEDKQDKLVKNKAAEEQAKRDYEDKIGFLAGDWNVASKLNCSCAWNGNVYRFVDVVAIKDKTILVGNKQTGDIALKGILEGDSYTSIKWYAVASANAKNARKALGGGDYPDFPIQVTVEKNPQRLSWKHPQAEVGGNWSWDGASDVVLTK